MSTKKKINKGDLLSVGALTDDYLGAFIEVGEPEGIRYRLTLGSVDVGAAFTSLVTKRGDERRAFSRLEPVKVIAPPPIVQPDEPTALGQMFRVEGLPDARGFRARGSNGLAADSFWWRRPTSGTWSWDSWSTIKERVGDHQIIVSEPPRWPSEDGAPKAGDTFDRIEDVPYGWTAKVTLGDLGDPWGHVVRREDDLCSHRWDEGGRYYGQSATPNWLERRATSRSGGALGKVCYTLVETAQEHDERIYSGDDMLMEVL